MKRKILAVLLSVSLLLMTAAPVLGTLATEETVTPAPVETSVPTTEPTSEPTDTPETVVPMNETEPEESEQPAETEIPTGTEQPAETEIPTGTEQPTETEIPTGTEQPTETETPTETEEPDESEQPEAPAALSAVLTTGAKSAFAGEGEIAAKVTVAGGVAPYSIAFKAVNGESVKEETIVLETAGEATVTCAPAAFGTAVLNVVVTDANGASAEAGVSVPVAVRETEKKSEWEAAFENIELSGEWREDILTIARTQLGYEESQINFVVREDGSRQGYTRYGAWYGLPYDEWCAMFASFCVNYAGIDEEYFPRSANTSAWASALNTLGAYEANDPESEENYVPQAGDLIFFQWEGEERICHVGIVETVTETTVTAIEGNSNGAVRRVEYALDSLEIAGYANLDVLIARAAEIEAAKNPVEETPSEPELPVQPENVAWEQGLAEVTLTFTAPNAVSYGWQRGLKDETGEYVWEDMPGMTEPSVLITANIDNMKYAYRGLAFMETGEALISDAVTLVSEELVAWLNEQPADMEMLTRAMSAKSLESLVIEDDKLVYVRDGSTIAYYNAETGELIDACYGLTVATVDLEAGMVYPVAEEMN